MTVGGQTIDIPLRRGDDFPRTDADPCTIPPQGEDHEAARRRCSATSKPWWTDRRSTAAARKEAEVRTFVDARSRSATTAGCPGDIPGIDLTGMRETGGGVGILQHAVRPRTQTPCCWLKRSRVLTIQACSNWRPGRSALIARFHTVEWTTACCAIRTASHERQTGRRLGRDIQGPQLGRVVAANSFGHPRIASDHHAAPFSLTEEFVSATACTR